MEVMTLVSQEVFLLNINKKCYQTYGGTEVSTSFIVMLV